MIFALASYGTRGDIEPTIAAGRELLRRGHIVRVAVPPNLVGFVESAGLKAVAYGPDQQEGFWDVDFLSKFWKVRKTIDSWREAQRLLIEAWAKMSHTLLTIADGADLLFTGPGFPGVPANVAEYYNVPLAVMHYFPMLPNSQLAPKMPAPAVRSAMRMLDWPQHFVTKKAEEVQRHELGLPTATRPAPRRITARGSLEIQAYDKACFPELAIEWSEWGDQRPFVGTLTIETATDTDEEVASWIADGTPPIFFGFGSTTVKSPIETVEMIAAACTALGERALVGSGRSDFSDAPHFDHVKVVGLANYASVFPACRAVVHHSGAGTTAAGLRAGVPTLSLWSLGDQRIWANQIARLKVGTARPFSTTTRETLASDLRKILTPDYVARAREIATQMTAPAKSITRTADLLENFARSR
ncbi:glycosyl transferase, UDP-glucuronosyltransferase [Mycolicibacterium rhodesiae NBB3]|uniref:Glycosyl transferase, UDP-glucuronosyltransferase n=1 Tax=Mycolicibacterium rhodesiae (strain NBB3) TaxID=710685 RepID=G8RIW7_MYCRN|nr:glycosyltransferase [Mycolicibacterium rhodesiae]AEV70955.1 glycosyl transferase, UDP-glucuronosyltransferase [Mycolicibacterium rhodesiae NBB3]